MIGIEFTNLIRPENAKKKTKVILVPVWLNFSVTTRGATCDPYLMVEQQRRVRQIDDRLSTFRRMDDLALTAGDRAVHTAVLNHALDRVDRAAIFIFESIGADVALSVLRTCDFYHGSTSESLFSFVGDEARGLLPNPVYRDVFGHVPLAGELDYGNSARGVNQIGLSVVPWPRACVAIDYAHRRFDVRDAARVKDALSLFQGPGEDGIADVHRTRLRTLIDQKRSRRRILEDGRVTCEVRNLVQDPFPVIYGLRLRRPKTFVNLDHLFGERSVLVADHIGPEDLDAIFVPPSKITLTREIVHSGRRGRDIRIEAICDLQRTLEAVVDALRVDDAAKRLFTIVGAVVNFERGNPRDARTVNGVTDSLDELLGYAAMTLDRDPTPQTLSNAPIFKILSGTTDL